MFSENKTTTANQKNLSAEFDKQATLTGGILGTGAATTITHTGVTITIIPRTTVAVGTPIMDTEAAVTTITIAAGTILITATIN